jgi:hypothetical protein
MKVWGACALLLLFSCASGSTSSQPAQSPPQSATATPSSSAPGPQVAAQPDQACTDVCSELEACAEKPLADCTDRCAASTWVQSHGMRCLALRIEWINEEGCAAQLRAYDSFSPQDDCSN